jgi:CheY-like chemotaxis protein
MGAPVCAADVRTPTILVADDSDLNRTLFRRLLGRAGYNVIETKDGCETLEEIERRWPDLVLLDLRMPEIDGVEVLREVRRSFDQASLPVIIVTADHDIAVARDCLDAGANDYITKPIVWSLLRARLETHLILHARAIAQQALRAKADEKADEVHADN